MQLVLSIYSAYIKHDEIEQKYTHEVSGSLTIFINDIPKRNIAKRIDNTSFSLPSARELKIRHAEFFKMPKTPYGTWAYKEISSKAEYEAYVEQNFDMLVYMLEHCQSLEDLYALYDNCEHNEHLRLDEPSTSVWNKGVGYETLTMLYLAYLTKQADYPQRVEQYRQEYLQWAKRSIKLSQEHHKFLLEKGRERPPLPPFEQMFAVYNEMFDRLVAFIESLDVDAILSAPPVREDIECLKDNWQ